MRVAVIPRWVALISVLGCWCAIGAECLPSVGELRLVGEHAFQGPLAGIALEPTWHSLAWVETWSIRIVDPRWGDELARIALPPRLRFGGRAALSAAGLLAIALTDGTVQVWDVRTSQEVGSFPARIGGVCAALSEDGTLLATTGPEGELHVWDVPSGELRFSFAEFLPSGRVCPAAFSPDGRWLVARAWTGSSLASLVWELPTGRLARLFPGPVEFLPNGQLVVLVQETTATRVTATSAEVWESPVGRMLARVGFPPGWEVNQVASHPSGSMFAVSLADGTIRLWDARSGQEIGALPSCFQTDPRTGELAQGLLLKFSPDGEDLLFGMWFLSTHRGVVSLWTVNPER